MHIIAVLMFCLHEHENIKYQDSLEKKLKFLAKKYLIKIVIAAGRSHCDIRELILELLGSVNQNLSKPK